MMIFTSPNYRTQELGNGRFQRRRFYDSVGDCVIRWFNRSSGRFTGLVTLDNGNGIPSGDGDMFVAIFHDADDDDVGDYWDSGINVRLNQTDENDELETHAILMMIMMAWSPR